MIETVKGFLVAHGLIQDGPVKVTVTIGRSTIFDVFQGPHVYVTVKVSRTACLEREFTSQRSAYLVLPEYVPAPLAFGASNGLFFLVSEGAPHVRLTVEEMRNAGERVSSGIKDYVQRSAIAFSKGGICYNHHSDLEYILEDLGYKDLTASMISYLLRAEIDQIKSLPRVRQHGDFVVGNLGLSSSGIVVFDWEDFGRVELPGFDVGTLLASSLNYDARLLQRWFGRGEPKSLDKIITTAAYDIDLDRSALWGLLPVFLVHFLHLKKTQGYSSYIRRLVRNAIIDLCTSPKSASWRR